MFQLSKTLSENENNLKNELNLNQNYDIVYKKMCIDGVDTGFVFIDGFLDDGVAQRILQYFYGLKKEELSKGAYSFLEACVPYVEVSVCEDSDKIISDILSGVMAFFIDGMDKSILIDCRTYPMRSISEPYKDKVLRGSRDGFVETLVFNIALVRRRIRDPKMCVESLCVGERSRTDIALCYIKDKADAKLVNNIKKRIAAIKVEALNMSIESLAECLLNGKYINPFPKYKYSERPDTVAAALLDGNIAVMVDNSPAVMILPTTFFDMLEEADDYNFPPAIGTYIRLSRFLITVVSVIGTPVWMIMLNNPEIVPKWLQFILITDDITVPVILQLLILELAIDGLRLAAVNTPQTLSTPLSIIAGIVVGESAVASGWFNSESMLYMAFVSVATYSQASFEMGYAVKFCRVMILVLSAVFNWIGFGAGCIIAILMICTNQTLSEKSYIYPFYPFDWNMIKRKVLRMRLPHSNLASKDNRDKN